MTEFLKLHQPEWHDSAMTVRKLKEIIKDLPDDLHVVVSSDEEGNSFSPVYDYGFSHFDGEGATGWVQDIYEHVDYPEEGEKYQRLGEGIPTPDEEGFLEAQLPQELCNSIILWP